MRWRPYSAPSVTGDLRVLRGELDRDLYAWLPPGYEESGRSYPVLYLHDAQNLFDEALSKSGEWRADETLTELAAEGLELIAVGIPHAGVLRSHEYVGRGLAEHVDRLVRRIVSLVEGDFRTRRPAGIGGSSFGAYASLYAWAAHPRTFSRVLAMSPAFFGDRPRIFHALAEADPADARIWMDVGGREHEDAEVRDAYLDGHRAIAELLRDRGFDEKSLHSEVFPSAIHHESAWAERLPAAVRFLYGEPD